MGVLLALVLVMQTDRGREILKERFTVGFDQRRKERAARFSGKRKRDDDARSNDEEANEDVEEDNTEDVDLHPIPTEVLIEEEERIMHPTDSCICPHSSKYKICLETNS
jgi:hypothetical protein